MSTFDYNDFAHDIAEQAGNLVPSDIDKNTKYYILKAVKSFTQMTGEAISKNESLNLDDEKTAFFCQIIAEVIFNKSLALAHSDVPQEYWDAILQRIAFYIFEITKESIKKRKEKFELLKLAEFHANKSYDEALEELV